jgi:hypothetical protein
MTWKMKRKMHRDFEEIEILKQKYLRRITNQENEMKTAFVEFRDHITGAALLKQVRENLFSGPGMAFRLGFMAVTMLKKRMKKKSGSKS